MLKVWLLIWILCGAAVPGFAQLDAGLGGGIESPFLFNKDVGGYNHYNGGPGLRMHVSYLPREATFVPTLSIVAGPYSFPVTQLGNTKRALIMNFRSINAMLMGRVMRVYDNNRELYFGLGIGATYMQAYGVGLSGNQEGYVTVLTQSTDYIKMVVPQMCLNLEYRIPISSEKPLGVGVGINVLYTYFYERPTKWQMDVVDDANNHYKLNPKLSGHMITPGLYVLVYYRFGRNNTY